MKDLHIGDLVEVNTYNTSIKNNEWVKVEITRESEHFLWFKGVRNLRIKRSTIDQGIFYRRII